MNSTTAAYFPVYLGYWLIYLAGLERAMLWDFDLKRVQNQYRFVFETGHPLLLVTLNKINELSLFSFAKDIRLSTVIDFVRPSSSTIRSLVPSSSDCDWFNMAV